MVTRTPTRNAAPRRRQRASASAAQLSSAVHAVLDAAPASVKAGFVETVAARDTDGLDESLWGSAPTAKEMSGAALQALQDDFVARRELLTMSLSTAEVAELLDISSQAVLDRITSGDLIGLKDGRQWRIPMWQLNAGAQRGFLPGIAQLRQAFPGGIVALSKWAATPNPELGDITPADALVDARIDDVIAVVAKSTAAAW
ncbi:helix-turn-helix domain-containing protein [Mycobacterium marinum]|uniref:helix-turn-helix domain-containing protein n=1 Tax=Mycobacterium marinum TaxID=1781 RepID=UPI000E3E6E8B|nr:helix-turn-helix domain-containing protein [Mycobacterium marinum]